MIRRGRRGRSGLPGRIGAVAAIAAFVAMVATAAALRSSGEFDLDPRTGCPARGHSRVTVVLVDASNRLAPRNEEALRSIVAGATRDRRDSRVIIVRFSGRRDYRRQILFDRCNPGGARDARTINEGEAAREDNLRINFTRPLEAALGQLLRPVEESDESFVAETIARAVADPALHLDRGERRLIILSDFIENTDISRPYQNGVIRLPDTQEPFLAGIGVALIELPAMPGAERLQTFETRAQWRRWCGDAGAPGAAVVAPGLVSTS